MLFSCRVCPQCGNFLFFCGCLYPMTHLDAQEKQCNDPSQSLNPALRQKCYIKHKKDDQYKMVTLELLIFLFSRYLYQQLQNAYNKQPGVFHFQEESNLCALKNGVSFHLFTSHTPCEYFVSLRF